MYFDEFADLLESIGFRRDEDLVTPVFKLNAEDINDPALRKGYAKVVGSYHVISVWAQSGEVAFWAEEDGSGTKLFPFFKEEVEWLAKNRKFLEKMKRDGSADDTHKKGSEG